MRTTNSRRCGALTQSKRWRAWKPCARGADSVAALATWFRFRRAGYVSSNSTFELLTGVRCEGWMRPLSLVDTLHITALEPWTSRRPFASLIASPGGHAEHRSQTRR